ncbi:MAG: TetR/AcrR family transcriptional regulator [Pseudomonadota bacterium]
MTELNTNRAVHNSPTQGGSGQERAQVTRERLLKAAIRSFASVGYEASSTRQIETDAGVKRGLISYHFGTKESLWKAAATWMFQQAQDEMENTAQNAVDIDPVARLRYSIRAIVRFFARYPEVNRLMTREGMDNDWRLEWLIEHASRPWYEQVRKLYEEAQKLGMAPAMDYPHFYYILVGSAALIFTMAPEAEQLAGIDINDESVVSAHADALADLLFPGEKQ